MLLENFDIDFIRKTLEIPDLKIFLTSETSSSQPELRTHLRQKIFEYYDQALENGEFPNFNYESKVQYDFKELLDLNKIPHPQWGGLSISHSPKHGAFVTSFECKNLGLDIEESKRLQKQALLRLCTEEELDQAPSLGHLWTAKEAAFKSFYRLNPPKVLSDIHIFDWNERKENNFHFRFKLNSSEHLEQSGEGLSLVYDCLNLSICKI